MICPECKTKMKCMESMNDAESMCTARRYKCPKCNKKLYTSESIDNKAFVDYILSQRWQNGKRGE